MSTRTPVESLNEVQPAAEAEEFALPAKLGEDLPEVALRKASMRCPVCFAREIDVLMIPNGEGGHRCMKCSYAGDEEEIRSMYRDIQRKYTWIGRRLTLDEQRAL